MGRQGAGEGRLGGRAEAIAVWTIEPDPAVPGRVVMRDESGDSCFVSGDGGRSWERSALPARPG